MSIVFDQRPVIVSIYAPAVEENCPRETVEARREGGFAARGYGGLFESRSVDEKGQLVVALPWVRPH